MDGWVMEINIKMDDLGGKNPLFSENTHMNHNQF